MEFFCALVTRDQTISINFTDSKLAKIQKHYVVRFALLWLNSQPKFVAFSENQSTNYKMSNWTFQLFEYEKYANVQENRNYEIRRKNFIKKLLTLLLMYLYSPTQKCTFDNAENNIMGDGVH